MIMAVLTSGGDIAGLCMESRRPIWGDDRVLRDLRLLRKIPSLVRFTSYGRVRWEQTWLELSAPAPADSVVPLATAEQ
jgi:hypothetical protein